MKKIFVTIIVVMLFTASILLSPAVAGAEANIRTAVVVCKDNDVLTLLDGAGLIWSRDGIEDFEVFDVVSFSLIDTTGTKSILDDSISQPIYSAIRVDRQWVIKMLTEIGELDLAAKLIEEQASA